MQLGHVLVAATIADEAVAALPQVEFLHQALHGEAQIHQEIGVGRGESYQAGDLAFGHDKDMQGVGGFGVVKSQQGVGFAQAVDGDDEAHMGEYPTNQGADNGRSGQVEEETPEMFQ